MLPLVDRHDRGASGEERVGGLLEEPASSGGWHVVHDANLGHGNVDHIAIGTAGVFTVETKSHPGPVRVAAVHGSMLAQAQAERRAIERATGEQVEPLVVYSRAWVDRPLARRRACACTGEDARATPHAPARQALAGGGRARASAARAGANGVPGAASALARLGREEPPCGGVLAALCRELLPDGAVSSVATAARRSLC